MLRSSGDLLGAVTLRVLALAATVVVAGMRASPALAQATGQWAVHDTTRPPPPVVDPGTMTTVERPGRPPADAVVLFDGTHLSRWERTRGGAPKWKVEHGYMEVVPKGGDLATKQAFGDCQLHLEWSTPAADSGRGQDRGNSGVFLMGRYEVQVLDSYRNATYPDGQAAAVYGQYPPLVNVSRRPGEWQTYDIVFRRPRFEADGTLRSPARMTVFHNGVLVQDNVVLTGPSGHKQRPPYAPHADKLSIVLQDHGDLVRYRNIWVRELDPPLSP